MSWSGEYDDEHDTNERDTNERVIITEVVECTDMFDLAEWADNIVDKLRHYAWSRGLNMLMSDESAINMMILLERNKMQYDIIDNNKI